MARSLKFRSEEQARAYIEEVRWPHGPVCPHCGHMGGWKITSKPDSENKVRPGLYKCTQKPCRKQFSVTVGTVFERSKIPLAIWLNAADMMAAGKKGTSAHQIHRMLGVTYKTAWFLMHRLRFAMQDHPNGLMGTGGPRIVEADETYIGRKPGRKVKSGPGHKNTVFSLVERDGKVRSFHITGNEFDGIKKALKLVSPDAHLMTDSAKFYRKIGQQFVSHTYVDHSRNEYVRGNVSTNTIEGFFSVFKRGMIGTYQHCGSQHLHRYLAEFDFRYNHRAAMGVDDNQRARDLIVGISGKRLTYR